jgi:chromosome segregation ATPase
MSEEHFDRIEQRLDRLKGGQQQLRADLGDLDRHMHVLHEDVIARIAAIPEYSGPTRAEMQQSFADLRETIERRLDPLEATVRQHTIEIERLKQTRKPRH